MWAAPHQAGVHANRTRRAQHLLLLWRPSRGGSRGLPGRHLPPGRGPGREPPGCELCFSGNVPCSVVKPWTVTRGRSSRESSFQIPTALGKLLISWGSWQLRREFLTMKEETEYQAWGEAVFGVREDRWVPARLCQDRGFPAFCPVSDPAPPPHSSQELQIQSTLR